MDTAIQAAWRIPARAVKDLARAWNWYWFADPGDLSLAVARIAIGLAVLLSQHTYLVADYQAYFAIQGSAAYTPGSLMQLFPAPPSPEMCTVLRAVAVVSTWLLIAGVCSRWSAVACLVSNLVLLDVVAGFLGGHSVALNAVFLSLLGLAFAPTGNRLSVDALLRRWWAAGRPRPRPDASRWAVVLAQLAITLMFFNACFHKMRSDDFHLGWAFSDNLRFWLIYRYFSWQEAPTWVADLLMHRSGLTKLAALTNLVCQFLPLWACVFVKHKWLRLLFGLIFFTEMMGLGMVVGFWCFQWLPLAVLFVDWEALARWVQRLRNRGWRIDENSPALIDSPAPALSRWRKALASGYICLFVGWFIFVAFGSSGIQSFPFDGFTAFSMMLAKRPLNVHQSAEWVFARVEIDGKECPEPRFSTWIYYNFRSLAYNNDLDALHTQLALFQRAECHGQGAPLWELGGMPRWGNWQPAQRFEVSAAWMASSQERDRTSGLLAEPKAFALKRVFVQVPPFPADPTPRILAEGYVAALDRTGSFVGLSARYEVDTTTGKPRIALESRGLRAPTYRFEVVGQKSGKRTPLPGRWKDDRYYYEAPSEDYCVLIQGRDEALGATEVTFFGFPAQGVARGQ
jgi:hypothetical protein